MKRLLWPREYIAKFQTLERSQQPSNQEGLKGAEGWFTEGSLGAIWEGKW